MIVHPRPLPGRHLHAHHDQITEVHDPGGVLVVACEDLHEISRAREAIGRITPSHASRRSCATPWDWIKGMP